ncbi:MAG: hypothetical protein ACC700_10355 [Anaerolineales bacterium]
MTIAFVANWDGDREIYTIQADGSNQTQLTSNTSGDVLPTWSPDGEKLAYIVDRYTDPRLYVSAADGSEGGLVAPEIEVAAPALLWSPASDKIVFRDSEDVYVVDIASGDVLTVTQGSDLLPLELSFSPDGSTLAFTARLLGETPGKRLFVVNVDGTGLREISFPQGDVSRPMWHPSQDRILFEGIVPGEGAGLYVASLDGAIEELPMVPVYGVPRPTWSPDGSMIAYIVGLSGLDSNGEILSLNSLHVATAAGDVDLVLLEPPDEPDAGLAIHELIWAPDSRHIAYSTSGETGTDLFLLDICDGTSTPIVEGIDFYSTPSWRPLP